MVLRQYPLALFTTTLFITLTTQPGVAFTIKSLNPPDYYVPYTLGDAEGAAWIIPPTTIKAGGTNELKSLLSNFSRRYPGKWIFETGTELEGSFDIKNYYACGPQTDCGREAFFPSKGGVGSSLFLEYHPKGNDPKIDSTNPRRFQWIQRVKSNHSLTTDRHNDIENILDIGTRQTTPYYSGHQGSVSTYKYFGDAPYRIDPLNNHTWNAELYLVEEVSFIPRTRTRTLRIYNGIGWGWRNQIFRRKQPVPVPVPAPARTPNPIPFPIPIPSIPKIPNLGEPVASSASGGGGIGYVAVSPSPTPRPSPSPTPRPSPSPTPWTSTPWTSTPWTSTPWTSTPWTSTPWVTSPLGSTSSTVVVSTSTTITSSSPLPKPSSPASSPGGRPIQAAPLSAISKGNAANLRSSSLFESSSKANTDYLTAISSDLLEDSELSSTDSSLNNANLAGVSRDLLEDSELSLIDNNENQVNLADISSNLLEDSELSSTDNNENQVNLAGISSDLLEDPELSSTENDENNADIGSISADLLQDQELSSEDNNSNQVDLAGISADLLEDPELSYLDDTLIAKTQNISAKNTDDDALSAEAVPEPTTGLGTLLALAILPVIKRLTNRKNK
ncbi:hypothetical protein [Microcoleus anatoxicus]|uniref:PEP-CTERM sorting domain-containing protein n=1 Tax=Microcoleus anatoxicus PTRS2 TaxID=2705321 RepID=A0ABU8YSD5_9CYAN